LWEINFVSAVVNIFFFYLKVLEQLSGQTPVFSKGNILKFSHNFICDKVLFCVFDLFDMTRYYLAWPGFVFCNWQMA
jgi:hypothetical protein